MPTHDVVEIVTLVAVVLGGAALGFATLWLRAREKLIRHEHAGFHHGANDSERLERMERAIDSIAIEVERLGESDRFAAQLLAARAMNSGEVRAGRVITPH
jgi:hypothetical protein